MVTRERVAGHARACVLSGRWLGREDHDTAGGVRAGVRPIRRQAPPTRRASSWLAASAQAATDDRERLARRVLQHHAYHGRLSDASRRPAPPPQACHTPKRRHPTRHPAVVPVVATPVHAPLRSRWSTSCCHAWGRSSNAAKLVTRLRVLDSPHVSPSVNSGTRPHHLPVALVLARGDCVYRLITSHRPRHHRRSYCRDAAELSLP